MRLTELRKRLGKLRDQGFVPSQRRGPTGVGYTLEQQLGLIENNLPIPDIGGRVEVKTTRLNTKNLITLFTFNRGAWHTKQSAVVEKWGYIDNKGRHALYCTVSATSVNSLGFLLDVNRTDNSVSLMQQDADDPIATWDLYHIVGKFVTKFERMLFVQADSREVDDAPEAFHYVEAQLLSEPSATTFRRGFDSGAVMIDVRMHMRENGSIRNHGTAFRIDERDLPALFGKSIELA